jgi:hypothetical protein
MNLLCLKCASADCKCGRLALAALVRELHTKEVGGVDSGLVLGSIDCAPERADAAAELEGLFLLKRRYDP